MQICIYLLGEKQIGGLFTDYVSLPSSPLPPSTHLYAVVLVFNCNIYVVILIQLYAVLFLLHEHLGRMLGWECYYVCLLLSIYVNRYPFKYEDDLPCILIQFSFIECCAVS